MLAGLYSATAKSPRAAHSSRFSMVSQGVSRSLRLMTQKSWVSGAPSRAPPEMAAVRPPTTSTPTVVSSPRSS